MNQARVNLNVGQALSPVNRSQYSIFIQQAMR